MHRLKPVLAALLTLAGLVAARPAAAAGAPPVLAVYYAWYDANTWASGQTSDLPATPYTSSDSSAIQRQVQQAQSAGIDGFELNWWGPGNPTDSNLQKLLDVARPMGFKVAAYVDLNGPSFNSAGDVAAALSYVQRYFGDSAYFHFQGKPFVAFYNSAKFDTATWASIFKQVDPGHQVFWMGEGADMSYASVFDGMHPFSTAWSPDPAGQLATYARRVKAYPGKVFMPTVMPGYDDTRLHRSGSFAVARQAGAYYLRSWQGALALQPSIVSITSWNEWMEGSQIEPSKSYGDLYLRETKQMVDQLHGSASPPAPAGHSATFPQTGYSISDDGGMSFYTSFQALGGVDALGYPASNRFQRDGFTYQAMQGAVLQWRPELGRAILANSLEWFTPAGLDGKLLADKGIPMPIQDDGSNGDWQRAKQTRLSWLTDDAIRAKFLAAGSTEQAIELYGLPTSRPEQHGPFIVQRFQRMAFQQWTAAVPGMPAPGSVVRVLSGDLLKEFGLI